MSKHRKSWNQEERLRIIQYAAEQGVAKACTEFNVSSSIIYRWQKEVPGKSESDELHSLKSKLRLLERENNTLKEIVADQVLSIKIKDTLLKKSLSKEVI